MDMTPSQKAKITRQKHREAQRAKEAENGAYLRGGRT